MPCPFFNQNCFNSESNKVCEDTDQGWENDCFFLERLSIAICGPQFLGVDIYNRWGKLIFTSPDRKFKWCADGFPTGQYYYSLQFTDRTYKGILAVIK